MTTRFRLGAAALCAVLFTAGCDFNAAQEAFDGLAIVLELDDIETTASGQLVDVTTNELLARTATIRFSGPNGADLVDFYNDPVTSLKAAGGLVSFGLNNASNPGTSPVTFTVTATAEGYLPGSALVTINEDNSENPFIIYMMKASAGGAADGTTSAQSDAQSSNSGALTSTVSIGVDDTGSDAVVDVAIPSGSVLKTASGEVLSGQLSTTLTYYNNDKQGSLLALPQGYNKSADGANVVLAFATSIYITDEDGNIATSISGTNKRVGATQRIVVPSTLMNPVTGVAVAAGDVLTLLYFNGTTNGTWEQVTGSETVTVEDEDGTLVVNVDVAVLGAFAFGFPLPAAQACDVSGSFSVDTAGRTGTFNATLTGTGFSQTRVVSSASGALTGTFKSVFGLNTSTNGNNFSLTVSQGIARSTVQGVNVCSGTTSAALPAPPASATNVRLAVVPTCADSGQEVRVTNIPATTIFFRRSDAADGTFWTNAGSPTWETDDPDSPTFLVRGILDIDNIATGVNYDFYTTYDGDRYTETDILVPASGSQEDGRRLVNFEIDAEDVCS